MIWQVPLTVLACVAGTLLAVLVLSQVAGFSVNLSRIAALSAVLSGAAIARELRARSKHARRTVACKS
jgi:hypothetical protein